MDDGSMNHILSTHHGNAFHGKAIYGTQQACIQSNPAICHLKVLHEQIANGTRQWT